LNEGNGKAIYRIGFLDNGFPQGISEDEMKISIDALNGEKL
jgi:GTPase